MPVTSQALTTGQLQHTHTVHTLAPAVQPMSSVQTVVQPTVPAGECHTTVPVPAGECHSMQSSYPTPSQAVIYLPTDIQQGGRRSLTYFQVSEREINTPTV